MKKPCKWCGKKIDPRGMPSHEHFKHRDVILRTFTLNPIIVLYRWMEDGVPPHFDQKQLPAPNPFTMYSTRPLGHMAAPISQHRIPKGYTPGYGHARPFELLGGQPRFNRFY